MCIRDSTHASDYAPITHAHAAKAKTQILRDWKDMWKRLLAAWDAHTRSVQEEGILDLSDREEFFPVEGLTEAWERYSASLRRSMYQDQRTEWIDLALGDPGWRTYAEKLSPAQPPHRPLLFPAEGAWLVSVAALDGDPRPLAVQTQDGSPPIQGDSLLLTRLALAPWAVTVVGPSIMIPETPQGWNTIRSLDFVGKAWIEES